MTIRNVGNQGVDNLTGTDNLTNTNNSTSAPQPAQTAVVRDENRDTRLNQQFEQSRNSMDALRVKSQVGEYNPIRNDSVRGMSDEIDIVDRQPVSADRLASLSADVERLERVETKTVSLKAEPQAAIKDLQTVTSKINVTDDMTIDKLTVSLDVSHTYRGDLEVTLTSPTGEQVKLHNRTGGSADNLQFTVDRNEFAGKVAKGEWTLTVADKARVDEGVLKSWGLDITGKVKINQPPPTPREEEVVVAVFDGGVDFRHTDLDNNMWTNKGEIDGDGIDNDGNGYIDDMHGINSANLSGDSSVGASNDHGTHVAGIIAAEDNGVGTTGLAAKSNVKILSVGAIYDGRAQGRDLLDNFEAGVDYVVKMKKEQGVNIRVINCSFSKIYNDAPSQARWNAAIQKLADADIMLTASGGNTGVNVNELNRFPNNATHPNIITVAALNTTGEKLASFSSFGDKVVELAAPGEKILSTVPGGKYEEMSGTSMAAPYVAAAAAILFAKNPNLTAVQAREIIMSTVDYDADLDGKVSTKGKINVEKALAKAVEMLPPSNEAATNSAAESSGVFSRPRVGNAGTRTRVMPS